MGNKAVEEKGIQVAEVLDMVVVQGSEIQVMGHMADYTGHTCMDYSLLALAFGNTLGNLDKLGKEVPVPVKAQCLMHWLLELE